MKTEEAIDLFLESRRSRRLSETTIDTYRWALMKMGQFHPLNLPETAADMQQVLIMNSTLSSASLRTIWARLRIFWSWAEGKELGDGGDKELMEMEREVRVEPKLRRLVVELSDKWRSLTRHKWISGLPRTNNCTERVIGRSKVRYKTVRGYKSLEGMMNGLGLTQWVWSGDDGLALGELVGA